MLKNWNAEINQKRKRCPVKYQNQKLKSWKADMLPGEIWKRHFTGQGNLRRELRELARIMETGWKRWHAARWNLKSNAENWNADILKFKIKAERLPGEGSKQMLTGWKTEMLKSETRHRRSEVINQTLKCWHAETWNQTLICWNLKCWNREAHGAWRKGRRLETGNLITNHETYQIHEPLGKTLKHWMLKCWKLKCWKHTPKPKRSSASCRPWPFCRFFCKRFRLRSGRLPLSGRQLSCFCAKAWAFGLALLFLKYWKLPGETYKQSWNFESRKQKLKTKVEKLKRWQAET